MKNNFRKIVNCDLKNHPFLKEKDVYSVVLEIKMANKKWRPLDVLGVGGLSYYKTQDMEDFVTINLVIELDNALLFSRKKVNFSFRLLYFAFNKKVNHTFKFNLWWSPQRKNYLVTNRSCRFS